MRWEIGCFPDLKNAFCPEAPEKKAGCFAQIHSGQSGNETGRRLRTEKSGAQSAPHGSSDDPYSTVI